MTCLTTYRLLPILNTDAQQSQPFQISSQDDRPPDQSLLYSEGPKGGKRKQSFTYNKGLLPPRANII